MYISSFILVF